MSRTDRRELLPHNHHVLSTPVVPGGRLHRLISPLNTPLDQLQCLHLVRASCAGAPGRC